MLVVGSKEAVDPSLVGDDVVSEFRTEEPECARVVLLSILQVLELVEDKRIACGHSEILMEVTEVEASWISVTIAQSVSLSRKPDIQIEKLWL